MRKQRIPRILPFRHRRDDKAIRLRCREILHAVDGEINSPLQQLSFDGADKDASVPRSQGLLLLNVPFRPDDPLLDLQAGVGIF